MAEEWTVPVVSMEDGSGEDVTVKAGSASAASAKALEKATVDDAAVATTFAEEHHMGDD